MTEGTTTQTAREDDPTEVRPAPTAPAPDPSAQAAPSEEASPAPKGRRQLKRGTKVRLLVIGSIALIAAIVFVAYYVLQSRNYVTTDNAQIDGNQISVNAPATGTLIDWRGQQGTQLHRYGPVGRIQMQGGFVQPQMVIRAPADGVIAVDNGVEGQYVTAGTQLAIAYDGGGVYVTARVDETDIDKVRPGEAVNISVDAFPDNDFTGRVVEIKTGAAGVFSLFPQSNTSGNYQKVTQVIPVKIVIDDLQGQQLVPGMNVVVKIHRR